MTSARDLLSQQQAEYDARPKERISYDDSGELDEVVCLGVAHLERMDGPRWHLSMVLTDGTEIAAQVYPALIEIRPAKAGATL